MAPFMAVSACQRERARTRDAILSASARCRFGGGGGARAARAWARLSSGPCRWLAAMWCSMCTWVARCWRRRDGDGAEQCSAMRGRAGSRGTPGEGEVSTRHQDRPEAARGVHGVGGRAKAEGICGGRGGHKEGRQEWKAKFNSYAGDFAYSHVCTETVKGRMGAVGMWGDYCEREGHGKFVEWQQKATGTLKKIVVPMRDASGGQIKVPDPECIAEYIMVMAIGDTQSRPKGGTAEYRAAWHHSQQPTQLYMKARKHGRGAFADTPIRFVSIEKMKEALAQFFDKHLQVRALLLAACGAILRVGIGGLPQIC